MTTLDTIDLSDHDAFLDAVPHEWFRTLRHEAPVFFNSMNSESEPIALEPCGGL